MPRWCRRGERSAGTGARRAEVRLNCSPARAIRKRPTKPGARGRPPTRAPHGSPITSPKARYLQWRAVLTGKGDGPVLDLDHRRLSAAQSPASGPIDHVHPPGIVFQKPFTTGEPDLAGFDDQTTPDRKLTSAAMSAQTGSAVARARSPHLPEGTADARLEGRRRERRRPALRRSLPSRRRNELEGASARRHGPDPGLGHDDRAQRHLLHQDRRLGLAVERRRDRADRASSTARRSKSTTLLPRSRSRT